MVQVLVLHQLTKIMHLAEEPPAGMNSLCFHAYPGIGKGVAAYSVGLLENPWHIPA